MYERAVSRVQVKFFLSARFLHFYDGEAMHTYDLQDQVCRPSSQDWFTPDCQTIQVGTRLWWLCWDSIAPYVNCFWATPPGKPVDCAAPWPRH